MIGVVADDITGANDIGIMFAKAGIVTHVYAYDAFDGLQASGGERPGAVVLDTNSRLDDPGTAYAKVREATRRLREAGASMWINKTCSVFRGNIGSEFDAMLDELGERFAVVVLGFPKNGRTTVDGIHYVRGVPLEQSEFRRDPVHPMTESRPADILQRQTGRRVAHLNRTAVARGPESLRRDIEGLRVHADYAILDVTDQEALRVIAQAVRDEYIVCGSSALAEELPGVVAFDKGSAAPLRLGGVAGKGILCAAGSLMPQTAAQLAYVQARGIPVCELDTRLLLREPDRTAAIRAAARKSSGLMLAGSHVVLHGSNDEHAVRETQRMGAELGLTRAEVSRLVSSGLAEAAALAMAESGQNRLIAAGGETSAAVCARLGVRGMRVHREIEPGLPSCVSLGGEPMLMVLKSGSFGGADFIDKAFRHLEEASFSNEGRESGRV